jgi:hypothetical protein
MENFTQIINRKEKGTKIPHIVVENKKDNIDLSTYFADNIDIEPIIKKDKPVIDIESPKMEKLKPVIEKEIILKPKTKKDSVEFGSYFKEIISKDKKEIVDVDEKIDKKEIVEDDEKIVEDDLVESNSMSKMLKLIVKAIEKTNSSGRVRSWEIDVERDDEKLIKTISMKEVID